MAWTYNTAPLTPRTPLEEVVVDILYVNVPVIPICGKCDNDLEPLPEPSDRWSYDEWTDVARAVIDIVKEGGYID